MKPRNKYEKNIVRLHNKLKPVSDRCIDWMKNQMTKHYNRTNKGYTCMECAKEFPLHGIEVVKGRIVCPQCKGHLRAMEGRTRTGWDYDYFVVFTTFKGYQVLRYFYIEKTTKKYYAADYYVREVYQHWIDENGKHTVMAVWANGYMFQSKTWGHVERMEIKNYNHRHSNHAIVYPYKSILPVLKRNGFKEYTFGYLPEKFMKLLLTDNKYETLLKCKQYNLIDVNSYYKSIVEKHWQQILIAIRHHYVIKDPGKWFDYIGMLVERGKDICNPTILCPEDINKAHDHELKKLKQIRRKKKLNDLKKELKKYNREYKKMRKRYFDLTFKEKSLVVEPMRSVEQILVEADMLNICTFENKYFEEKNLLLLSARNDDELLETVAYSFSKKKVVQASSYNNKPSKFHDEIIQLVEKNKRKINKIYKEAV